MFKRNEMESSDILLRKADLGDLLRYYIWVNEQSVRENAISRHRISFAEHVDWFKNKINSGKSILYIAENRERNPLGQVRFDIEDDFGLIDYSVDEKHRGRGVGKLMLSSAIKRFLEDKRVASCKYLKAWVKEQNIPSIKVFKKLGFQLGEEKVYEGNIYKIFILVIR